MKEDATPRVTVQRICKIAKNEDEVRGILDAIWKAPGEAEKILLEAEKRNKDVYDFERMLQQEA
jgi:t-SNARE complex subunit (syntaxin)